MVPLASLRRLSLWLLCSFTLGCSARDRKTSSLDAGAGGSRAVASAGGRLTSDGGRTRSMPGNGGSAGSRGGAGNPDSGPESGGAGGATGGGGDPASCPASDEGNVPLGRDTFVPNTGKQEVKALTYTNVGASGTYAEVVTGWSKATGCVGDTNGALCKSTYRKPKSVG